MTNDKVIFGDNFENSGGNMNIAKDHGTAIQNNVTEQAPVEDLLALLEKVQQELAVLPVSDEVKAEVQNEVQGAQIQAQKTQPEREKIADKLRNATAALEESSKTVKAVIAVGNMLGQGLIWCGKQWTNWM